MNRIRVLAAVGAICCLALAACGREDATTVDTQAPVPSTTAVVWESPDAMLTCPPETIGISGPGYDWEEMGEGSPTVRDAVTWFRERMPDEPTAVDFTRDELAFEEAVDFSGATWIPIRQPDGRVIAVLGVSHYPDEGYLVEGAYQCEAG